MSVLTAAFRKAVHRPRRVPSVASLVRALGTIQVSDPGAPPPSCSTSAGPVHSSAP